MKYPWYEFFAGGGMVRLGLGDPHWECTFANDICEKKAAAYRSAFGRTSEFKRADIAALSSADLPGHASLAWASFPCQDLSLAGAGAGLDGRRSGTFKFFWKLIEQLSAEHRAPQAVVLENVTGAITSHDGKDFQTILQSMVATGYRVGAVVMDAVLFLPHSRPRLFIIGIRNDVVVPHRLICDYPIGPWHTEALQRAYQRFRSILKENYVWWKLPIPKARTAVLSEIIQANPSGVKWNSPHDNAKLLNMMSELNLQKIEAARLVGKRQIGTVYKRIRPTENGNKIQRAELRLDGVAGCLRTPVGGSSRQTIVIIDKSGIRSRLLAPREAARLMGVHDSYPLPEKYNDAYHLFGDGVAVPVVNWLSRHLLLPLVSNGRNSEPPKPGLAPHKVGRQFSLILA